MSVSAVVPNRSKKKGDRAERAIVELLRSYGLDAYRVPLSGAVNGFKDDIEIRLGNETLRLESKVRGLGFGRIYKWLDKSDCLVIKADRQEALAVVSLPRLARLIAAASASERAQSYTPPQQTLAQPTLIANKPYKTEYSIRAGTQSIVVGK